MRVSMKLEMNDSPGELVNALKPISDTGGNIIAVIHQRDPEKEMQTLSVQIVIEIPEERLSGLIEHLKESGVRIQRIGEDRFLFSETLIMIGHLMHTDIVDTVDTIDKTGFAEVTSLNVMMPAINDRSSARIEIRALTRENIEHAVSLLRKVAFEKDILLIEPLED